MAGALRSPTAAAGASFELERLERDGGRLVVSGWWFGVRGIRFVRPALVVDGRQVLATLDDKPWPLRADGAWTAAFPWKDERPLDVSEVTLVVAPSVEVPLDAEAPVIERGSRPVAVVAPESPLVAGPKARPDPPAVAEPKARADSPPVAEPKARADPPAVAEPKARADAPPEPAPAPARPLRAVDEADSLREELRALELCLDETRERADRRDARCRELEHVAARERRAAQVAESERDAAVRAQAIAVADRDRMAAQHEEAVADREAATRARKRMLTQRDEATIAREAAEADRDRAIAQRDELRMARDEALLAHRALRDQLRGERAQADREQADRERAAAAQAGGDPALPVRPARVPLRRDDGDAPGAEDEPIGVRTIPAARMVAAHLHRAQRVRDHGITAFDLWVARILGTVAAVCFLALLAMVLKAFFAF